MNDKKITLYLVLLCIILMIWGSVLDGKRMRLKEVLEAENAELVTLVDEAGAKFEEAADRENALSRKLRKMQREIKTLKVKNTKLQKLNDQLRAELEEVRALKQAVEKKSREAVMAAEQAAAARNIQPQPAASPSNRDSLRIREVEKKVDQLMQLMRERDNMRSGLNKNRETAFASSLAVSDIESQLRFCREQVREYRAGSGEINYLKKKIERLEKELDSRTRELWETRLSMSSDLDACTMRLMEVSRRTFDKARRHVPPKPPCMMKIKPEVGPDGGNPLPQERKKRCGKCRECKDMQARLQAYGSRMQALQDELYRANHHSLAEIEQLKRALREKSLECHDSMGSAERKKAQLEEKNTEINRLHKEIRGREVELDAAGKELDQYRKNTEALLEQIRQQRAEIKKLKGR